MPPAAVLGDKIVALCSTHQIPNPATGIPQPGPPFPFSATVTMQPSTTVMIAGKPALTMGSWGLNLPPHIGLHPADPFMAPPMQKGTIMKGSATVMIQGKPAARTGDTCTVCFGMPGNLVGTAATVIIGG